MFLFIVDFSSRRKEIPVVGCRVFLSSIFYRFLIIWEWKTRRNIFRLLPAIVFFFFYLTSMIDFRRFSSVVHRQSLFLLWNYPINKDDKLFNNQSMSKSRNACNNVLFFSFPLSLFFYYWVISWEKEKVLLFFIRIEKRKRRRRRIRPSHRIATRETTFFFIEQAHYCSADVKLFKVEIVW